MWAAFAGDAHSLGASPYRQSLSVRWLQLSMLFVPHRCTSSARRAMWNCSALCSSACCCCCCLSAGCRLLECRSRGCCCCASLAAATPCMLLPSSKLGSRRLGSVPGVGGRLGREEVAGLAGRLPLPLDVACSDGMAGRLPLPGLPCKPGRLPLPELPCKASRLPLPGLPPCKPGRLAALPREARPAGLGRPGIPDGSPARPEGRLRVEATSKSMGGRLMLPHLRHIDRGADCTL